LLEYLSKRLLKQGFTVKATFSGEQAVKVASEEHYDVAIVDLKMPGMDGVETQKRIKEIQPYVQCIVLTAHGSIESALESGQKDAFQYLLKPVDYDNLLANIKEAYQKKLELQRKDFASHVESIQGAGLGPHGMRKAIRQLRQIYGLE
jgi:DNA-binding NtrC family response regulator